METMRRIFFLYNNYEREHVNVELISKRLESKNVQTFQGGITDCDILKKLFLARPHVIFTYPVVTYHQINIYMMLKATFHSVIITFTTEGLAQFHLDEISKLFVGFYDFPAELVDYHFFWGKYMAKYVGRELYRQHKVMKREQIKVFGNPMYEKTAVYAHPFQWKDMDDRKTKVLILTGFHTSVYTEQDFINAQDVVNVKGKSEEEILQDETFIKYKELAASEKVYAEKYTRHIVEEANRNPEVLFVVKLHPKEISIKGYAPDKLKYLKKLENIENIQIIEESVPIGSLLPYFQLLIHYGSTVDLEAYIYKVPTVKIELRDIKNCFIAEANRTTASTYYVDIDEENAISEFIDKVRAGEELFRQNKLTEKQLYYYMNYKAEENYTPSEQIADFLSGSLQFNKLNLTVYERLKYLCLWMMRTLKWRLLPVIWKRI